MELFNTLKDALNPAKFIDQAEKNTQAVLSYIQPKELSKTLIDLTADTTEFVRAQLAAVESIATITKEHTEEFVKSFSKSAK